MDRLTRILGPAPLVGVVMLAVAAPVGMLVTQHGPVPGAPVVVVVAPWNSAERVAEAASATLIGPGRIASVGLVHSPRADLVPALRAAGAWLVLDGLLSNAFCRTG